MDANNSTVQTGKVQRRTLRFNTIAEVLAEAQRIADADNADTIKILGNWSPGTILNHLAAWADFPFTGYPMKVPFFVRWFVRPMKSRFLTGKMAAGRRIPGIKDGTVATESAPTPAALVRFQNAFQRLGREVPLLPNPLFGKLTHEQWIGLNLRHAELHMSFVTY